MRCWLRLRRRLYLFLLSFCPSSRALWKTCSRKMRKEAGFGKCPKLGRVSCSDRGRKYQRDSSGGSFSLVVSGVYVYMLGSQAYNPIYVSHMHVSLQILVCMTWFVFSRPVYIESRFCSGGLLLARYCHSCVIAATLLQSRSPLQQFTWKASRTAFHFF